MTPSITAIANQKGGVGKTTTAVNLATAMAAIGQRVLVLDIDSQGNATTNMGLSKGDMQASTYGLLMGQHPLKPLVRATSVPNLSLVPASIDLAGADIELVDMPRREYRLRDALVDHVGDFDTVLIDCPPALNLITLNALVAADRVLVPLQTEFLALEGLAHLLNTIDLVKARYNPTLRLLGILLTMVDRRNRLSDSVEEEVRQHFKATVFNTVIPRNVRVSEAPSYGMPVLLYDLKCAGSQAYLALAKEVLNRQSLLETV